MSTLIKSLGIEQNFDSEKLRPFVRRMFPQGKISRVLFVNPPDGEAERFRIETALRRQVLNRGTRADQVQSGQGIGLSVVAELVALYEGELKIGESPLGGARIRLELPG